MAESAAEPSEPPGQEPPHAEILAPGPVLALGAFVVGVALHLLRPLPVFPTPANLVGGGLLVVVGLGVLYWGLRTMRGIDKSPDHGDEPSELLTDGPFAYSRNPLYLGLITVYLGLTLGVNSLWPFAPLVVLAAYFDRVARREEAYLEARFGEDYDRYADDVRRWL